MSIDNISFAVGEWNKDAFEFINSKMANGFFDIIMPMARQPIIWVPLYVFFAALIFINFKKQALYIYIFAAATIFFSDQLSAHVLKVFFAHPRPCADYTMMGRIRMLVDCGPGFSFPSSHATNHFAFAVFIITLLGQKIKWLLPMLVFWAALVCFGQVYVGVHFPLDVIGGGLLGTIIGYWFGYFCRKAVFPITMENS